MTTVAFFLTAWSRSLRFRLTAWYVGALALILVAAALLIYQSLRHTLLEETDTFLSRESRRLVAAASEEHRHGLDWHELDEAVETEPSHVPQRRRSPLPRNKSVRPLDAVFLRYVIGDDRARTVIASPELERQPALGRALDTRLPPFPIPDPIAPPARHGRYSYAGPDEERLMRVLTVPLSLAGAIGYVQVAVPWDHNADLLERLALLLALAVPTLLLLVALGSWALVGHTLQPIRRIAAEAERLDATDVPEALLPEATETDTEIGELVTTLNRMTTRLHRSFGAQRRFAQAQQQFAADASHELRTPLTILRGEMELALSRPRPSETYRATLHSALEEIARLSRIVEGLGLLARQDAAGIGVTPDRKTVDLGELAQAVCADLQPHATEKQIALHCAAGAPLPLAGNADQLYLLLRNLVDNAVKFTDAGGSVRVTVERGFRDGAAESAAVVTIADTGVGIAPEDIGQVFDRFWRADRSRSTAGTGLGLAIARQIAEAHGGTLTASSTLGAGSVFRLTLPTGIALPTEFSNPPLMP